MNAHQQGKRSAVATVVLTIMNASWRPQPADLVVGLCSKRKEAVVSIKRSSRQIQLCHGCTVHFVNIAMHVIACSYGLWNLMKRRNYFQTTKSQANKYTSQTLYQTLQTKKSSLWKTVRLKISICFYLFQVCPSGPTFVVAVLFKTSLSSLIHYFIWVRILSKFSTQLI